jgi:TRAP-type C4-dicarboxylate transport system substrate-binding protein
MVLGASLAFAPMAAAQTVLRVATDSGTAGSPSGDAIANWARTIEEGSGGEIQVRVFYQEELGGQLEVFDLFVAGEVDLMLSWPSTSYDARVGVLNTPYMVTTWEEAFEAYQPGGWVNSVLNDVFGDLGLVYFGAWPEGFNGVATRGRYAMTPEDAQGIRVRVPPMFPNAQVVEGLGFQTAAIPWGEVYTSLQTGVVDGDAGNVIYWDYEYFRDVLDFYVQTRHQFVTGNLLANADSFNRLSPEHQELVRSAALAEMSQQFEAAREHDDLYISKWVEEGKEYFLPTDAQLEVFAERVRAQVWPLLDAEIGQDIMDLIRANVN